MAVTLADLRFSFVYTRFPGRVHNSHVFQSSELAYRLHHLMLVSNLSTEDSYSIIGNSAYPTLKQQVMTALSAP